MNKVNARRILKMLDKLNEDISIMGSILAPKQVSPIPVRVKRTKGLNL